MGQVTVQKRQAAAANASRVGTAETTTIRRVALAVAVLAGTGLAFQVTLTRIFSLIYEYHFVFLVVSLGVLGLGLGAAAGYLVSASRSGGAAQTNLIALPALGLALVFPLAALLLAGINGQNLTLFASVVALLPFLLLGWVNALIYTRWAGSSNVIYGADLIGAAVGLAASLLLLTWFGPFGTTVAMGALAALAALLLAPAGTRWLLRAAALIAAALAVLTLLNGPLNLIAYRPENVTDAPPDKTLVRVLQDPAQEATVMTTVWGPFAQVHVVETRDESARFVFTDAGAGSIMLHYDPRVDEDFSWIEREIPYLPFTLGPLDNTLIIGAGAGYDVFIARYAGAENVTAVEVNPAIVNVTRQQADYNGGIFDLPGVQTVVTDGRNFVDRSDERYDLVYLNVVYSQAAAPSTSSLNENHIFTVEALRSYWRRLDDDGRIAFVAHNGAEGRRLLLTTLAALQAEGLSVPDALSHVAMVQQDNRYNDPTGQAWATVLVITRQPWSEDAATALADAVEQRGMLNLYIPHHESDSLFYDELRLRDLEEGTLTLDAYTALPMNREPRTVQPTTDDRPFFYFLNPGLPAPVQDLLQLTGLLVLGYFILVAVSQPRQRRHEWTRTTLALYFALLGGGFLLAEVALQQRFKLLLGDPVLSLTVTLGGLLLGGGLGSLFSQRFGGARLTQIVALAALGVAAWLVLALPLYPALVEAALPLALPLRVAVTLVALLPLGFLMGMPFPAGLRLAGDADPTGIPLYWGMNALASTLGATLATVVALLAGFGAALLIAAALYLVVAALVRLTWARVVLPAAD